MLVKNCVRPPPGSRRIFIALFFGVIVHSLFLIAVLSMMTAMWFGMSRSLGNLPYPLSWTANLGLLLQFPLVHSILLTKQGGQWLSHMIPGAYGITLSTTTYAIIASAQLFALFALWTPSGVVWWQAEGITLWFISVLYGLSWILLFKANYDAGAKVQSGALGWMSLLAAQKPRFPDMPVTGLFRVIRQPIYIAFALTLWTTPVWTPDQLIIAIAYTSYCLFAPLMKERRFMIRYGERFKRYRSEVPYMVPRFCSGNTPTDA